ncbi:hypothetical protein [Pseudomonas aeruginosa]|uniref:hypothetical protein n=1 Tax=Pseudomonas aeruginosa TaxID=287 RepID=UPI000F628CCB|nr:hypothetical protein [Pseudomonas aeruginosa]MBO3611316.1 hypothetical protein [Pseudomonas aeruginosa]MBO3616896.1 hypothetical protein [Pseudomonas aeruginosa]MBO3624967.1 hypothetical protein [Pseudomonas aeruginosa]MBO3630826.1 hypothetical protein [Pseudomonas aeruginosa]MCC0184932.1 hypothetical protein [Pseudomonas aeruginosa]
MNDKKNPLYFCATDKEVYDVLMSGKQRLTDSVLLDLAKDRGIFYSPNESRDELSEIMSLLTYDYYDLQVLLSRREQKSRGEKLQSIVLDGKLSIDEVRTVAMEFESSPPTDEKVKVGCERDKINVQVEYSELKYEKSRLMQRVVREANIEFEVGTDSTILRFPANAKGEQLAEKLKGRIEEKRKEKLPVVRIDLSDLVDHDAKTEFFTRLIRGVPGFRLSNVTNVRVESSQQNGGGDDDDDDPSEITDEARHEMLGVVRNVALKGESLLTSKQYQDLKNGGFYIASIIWRSDKTSGDKERVEFFAGFEKPERGEGFSFSIRGIYTLNGLDYISNSKKPKEEDKKFYVSLIESTALSVLKELRQEQDSRLKPSGGS